MKKRNVVFGASHEGELFVKQSGVVVDYFFDNSPNKIGCELEDIPIMAPHYDESFDIIVCNSNHDIDIVVQLLELGYKKISVSQSTDYYGGNGYRVDVFDFSKHKEMSIKNNKVALLSYGNSGSNAYCFKYMIERVYKTDCGLDLVLLDCNDKHEDYYYDILTSGTIVLTDSFTTIDRFVIQSWHGLTIKGIGYYDVKTNPINFESTHLEINCANHILSTGPFYSLILGACFGVHKSKFLEIGSPRIDVLLVSDGKALMEEMIPGAKNHKIILYLPTYRVHKNKLIDSGYIFNYNGMDFEEFNEFLTRNNAYFVMKMHCSDNDYFDLDLNDYSNIYMFYDKDIIEHDFYEYINAADILITDYSSVAFDYLILDRPMIFAHADYEIYKEENNIVLDPPSFYCPGAIVSGWNELLIEIESALLHRDNYSDMRRQISDMVFKYKDSDSSKRLLELIQNNINK